MADIQSVHDREGMSRWGDDSALTEGINCNIAEPHTVVKVTFLCFVH